MGIIPGVGEDLGAWASYAAARRASKEAKQFGKGSTEGLIAAEAGATVELPSAENHDLAFAATAAIAHPLRTLLD